MHGDEGVAGPWAAGAKPGDVLQLMGPGGGYTPSPDAAWHLMVGDLAAVPAIAASLAARPRRRARARDHRGPGPEDEIALETPGDLHLTWLHGDGTGDALAGAVRDLEFPAGDVHAFVHGEAAVTREIRRHLVVDRGIPRERAVRVRLLEGRPRRRGLARREGGFQPGRRRRARTGLGAGPCAGTFLRLQVVAEELVRDFPLFPLGIVALPHEYVPLHIFEERYRTMIGECLESDAEFGIIWQADDETSPSAAPASSPRSSSAWTTGG